MPEPRPNDGTDGLARPEAVLFDLDGTLVDTVPARVASWRDAFSEVGLDPTDDALRRLIGMDGPSLARTVADDAGRRLSADEAKAVDRRAGESFAALNRDPRALPGVHDVLGALAAAGIPWAIATSGRKGDLARSIDALRLDRAPTVVSGDDVEHAKPEPDLVLAGARRLGAAPDRTWYVGDAVWDVIAATRAGAIPVAVLAGSGVDETDLRDAGAVAVVASLADLAARVAASSP